MRDLFQSHQTDYRLASLDRRASAAISLSVGGPHVVNECVLREFSLQERQGQTDRRYRDRVLQQSKVQVRRDDGTGGVGPVMYVRALPAGVRITRDELPGSTN
jgi:hypothetical protein